MRADPIIVEVLRGGTVESVHAVDAVICDGDGGTVAVYGDGERNVFPRSAIKALQALALLESGAADAFALDDSHLALACASHNGEDFQIQAVEEMLKRAQLSATCLECGSQAPYHREDVEELSRQGLPITALHNNCSGKHAGFLALGQHMGLPVRGYVQPDSPIMREIISTLEATTKVDHRDEMRGVDGCSIPTFAIPLSRLAAAYGRFSVSNDASPSRARAMTRLRNACMTHPEMVGGNGRFDTIIMSALDGKLFTKTGAEGVFTVAMPHLGIGAALKCRDGATRAAEAAAAHLAHTMLTRAGTELTPHQVDTLESLSSPTISNWNGIPVGLLRISQG